MAVDASGDVQENIFQIESEPGAFFEYGEKHVHPSYVEACGGTLWGAIGGCAHQCLGLDENGTLPLKGGGDGDATHFFVALRQQELTGVGDLTQARGVHLKDAKLRSGTESVFDGAQDSETIMTVTFELQYRVDDMLQNLRASDATVFGDMADEEYRYLVGLGDLVHLRSGLPDLRDSACNSVDIRRCQGLDRVDDN